MTWTSPLQVALAIYFLWNLLGIAVLAGMEIQSSFPLLVSYS